VSKSLLPSSSVHGGRAPNAKSCDVLSTLEPRVDVVESSRSSLTREKANIARAVGDGAADEQGLIEFATLTKRSNAAMPEKLTTNTELRVVLADGRAIRVPASTAVRYELGSKPERAAYKVVSREGSGNNEHQHGSVRAAQGAPVWLVGFFTVPPGDAAWRSAPQIELARPDEVELHFKMARAPETRIGTDYAVVCTTTLLGVMIAFAEWWQIPLALIQVLFAVASVQSLRFVLRDQQLLAR
jgi:phage shock protein PspC (stress-responsive transcriptional regulator)